MKHIKKYPGFFISFTLLLAFIAVTTQQAENRSTNPEAQLDSQISSQPKKNKTTIKQGTWGTDALGEEAAIYFFDKDDDSYFLTNFAPYPVTLNGKVWPTSEHYFQAMKFPNNPEIQEIIRTAAKGSTAKELAADYKKAMRSDWFSVSRSIMKIVMLAKFTQNLDAQKLLLATGDKLLVEANPVDSFWAAGADGNGTNHTGLLLMEVRSELKAILTPNEKTKTKN